MTITVRRLAPDDWELARRVRLASVRDGLGGSVDGDEFLREQAGLDEQAWRDVLERHARFAAMHGDEPVGTTGWRPHGERGGHLYGMWVDPAHRGTGVSRLLIDAVVDVAVAAGCDALELKVEPANTHAIAVYHRTGFATVDEPPGGLVVMRRGLSGPGQRPGGRGPEQQQRH